MKTALSSALLLITSGVVAFATAQGCSSDKGGSGFGSGDSGAGDTGAQAQGIQGSEIGGPQNGQQQGGDAGGAAGEKPQAVAIGDKAMRIDTPGQQAGVVGAQQVAGQTQQHDKGTGSGGKGASGAGGPNRVEKGRAVPAGL